jgi:hypothetical protein
VPAGRRQWGGGGVGAGQSSIAAGDGWLAPRGAGHTRRRCGWAGAALVRTSDGRPGRLT